MKDRYKVIVLGSGPGGCVTASVLAKKGLDVLMIERGNSYKQSKIKDFSSQELNAKYANGGLNAAIGRKSIINFAEANCLGGGSEINSGLYHRLPENILKEWENKNQFLVDRSALEDAFLDIETKINVSYMPDNRVYKASNKIRNGSNLLGWKCDEIPRWFSYKDNCSGQGTKQTMSETFIPEYLSHGGKLIYSCEVQKIKKAKNGSNEIIVSFEGGQNKSFYCDYVFFSSGSINTPFIMKKSGIKKNIGKGLKMHPTFKFTALFEDEVFGEDMGVPVFQVKEFSPQITLGCSLSTKPFIGTNLYDSNNLELLNLWKRMSNYYAMIRPIGSGNIHHLPFLSQPVVTFNLTREDRLNLNKSINLLGRLLFKSGATALFPSISNYKKCLSMSDIDEIKKVPLNKFNLMTIHLFSSVQIGGNSNSYPLNPEGALWEDPSIYVSDSSMLPDSPSVNPQGTIMAMAKINAEIFLSKIKNEL